VPFSPSPLAGRMPPHAWPLNAVEVRPRPLDARLHARRLDARLAPAAADSCRHRPEFAHRHGEGRLARTAAGSELAAATDSHRRRPELARPPRIGPPRSSGRRGFAQTPAGARATASLARRDLGELHPGDVLLHAGGAWTLNAPVACVVCQTKTKTYLRARLHAREPSRP
jgi:hypothetical protein